MTDLNIILSTGAFAISLFSLLVSYISYREQITRERREELRSVVEKLIENRAQFNRLQATVKNDLEMQQESSKLNSLRSVYLEAAEQIIRRIPKLASVMELGTIAFENESESDFRQAREYSKMALLASKKSSLVAQCTAYRGYACSFYYYPPFLDVEQGRTYFRKAVDVLQKETDPYSLYALALTLRMWAMKESQWGNLDLATSLYEEGVVHINAMPEWVDLKKYETKFYAQQIGFLANGYLDKHDIEKAKNCIQKGEGLLRKPYDAFSSQIQGMLSLIRVRMQLVNGEKIDSARLTEGLQYFNSLTYTDPIKIQLQPIVDEVLRQQIS